MGCIYTRILACTRLQVVSPTTTTSRYYPHLADSIPLSILSQLSFQSFNYRTTAPPYAKSSPFQYFLDRKCFESSLPTIDALFCANDRCKEFGIFYPYRSSNKRYFRATGFSSTFDSRFIEYLYSNLERTKYAGMYLFYFFLLTFNPHPIPLYPPIFRHSF